MAYAVTFTHAAQVDAVKAGGLAAVESQVRAEIDLMLEEDLDCLGDLFFHTVEMPGGIEFLCTPGDGDDILRVDACERRETGTTVPDGPFAGSRIVMPESFSDE